MKKINGIFGPVVAGHVPAGAPAGVDRFVSRFAHRFTCGVRPQRRLPVAARSGWGGRAPLDDGGEILQRWSWQVLDPTCRRDPTEDDLRWLEEEIGASLPPDYRGFLGTHGWTGFAEALRFPLREAGPFGGAGEISSFLGFSSELRRDLAYLVSEVYAESLPAGMMPIASDPHENLLLLSVVPPQDDDARARIWFWDRECRGLDDQIDSMVHDLEAAGQDTLELDEDQILRRWEARFPERRWRPEGFTNVYAVADTFATFLASLYEAKR